MVLASLTATRHFPTIPLAVHIHYQPKYSELDNDLDMYLLTREIAIEIAEEGPSSPNCNYVTLSGFTSIEDSAAEVLGSTTFGLVLDDLTELTDTAAEHLGRVQDELILSGLTHLSDAAAVGLGRASGSVLSLEGVTELSTDAAIALGRFQGNQEGECTLDLSGLKSLSPEAASGLSELRGNLYLSGLTQISDEVAEALAEHQGDELMLGVANLSEKAMRLLAKPGVGCASLSDQQAARFKEMQNEYEQFQRFAGYVKFALHGSSLIFRAKNFDELVAEVQSWMDCDDVIQRTRQLRDLLNQLNLDD